MKRLFALLLCLVMVFSLAACAAKDSTAEQAPAETAAESAGKEGEASRAVGEEETEENTAPMHPLLYDFLEAEKIDDRLAILRSMRGVVGRREVDSLYAALELKAVPGTVLEELDNLEEILLLKKRFDAGRLRRS